MNCPLCESDTKVINSRRRSKLYRRRECKGCKHRFTTYEVSQSILLDIFDEYLPVEQVDQIAEILEKEFPESSAKLKV